MLPILGKSLLVRMVERVKAAKLIGKIVIASTIDPQDDTIIELCKSEKFQYYRGSVNDLLDRYFQVGKLFGAEAIVKIPSDCPLIDPQIIDKVLQEYLKDSGRYDYVSNLHPPTYPDGNDVEIVSMKALRNAWQNSKKDFEREHTTPYIWENPDQFRIGNVIWEAKKDYSMTHRWTIDYPEDYQFIKTVYEELYPINPMFGLYDILELLEKKPQIAAINSKYAGVNWYRHHLHELKTIKAKKTRENPKN